MILTKMISLWSTSIEPFPEFIIHKIRSRTDVRSPFGDLLISKISLIIGLT